MITLIHDGLLSLYYIAMNKIMLQESQESNYCVPAKYLFFVCSLNLGTKLSLSEHVGGHLPIHLGGG